MVLHPNRDAVVRDRIYVSSRTSTPKNGVLANEEGSIYGPPSISFVADCGTNDGNSVEIVNGPRLLALLALQCHEAADTHYTFDDLEKSKCPGNFILH